MSYAEITFKDKNPLKRWLQHKRLSTAIGAAKKNLSKLHNIHVCDYGAGNGELCKELAAKYRDTRIACYEPAPGLMREAKENLKGLQKIKFFDNVLDIPSHSIDALFCLEVFEHLPARETSDAFIQIERCLAPNGIAIIGVPNEVGIPALYKGCFRMVRRFGQYDARPLNIFRALIGSPPTDRPVAEIAPGFRFHFHHTGFDYRELKHRLISRFEIVTVLPSPFIFIGNWLNPEIYFVIKSKLI